MRLRGWRRVAFYGVCVALLVWTVFPVYYMIMLSLVTWEDLFKPRLYVASPTFENYYQTDLYPDQDALARKLTEHGLHGGRQAHIELGGIILKNRFSKNLV